MANNGAPIVPPVTKAPTQTLTTERTAEKKIKAALKEIQRAVLAMYNDVPRRPIKADEAGIAGNAEKTYIYQVTAASVVQMSSDIGAIIEQNLLESGAVNWFMYEAVRAAEEQGVGGEVSNIKAQYSDIEYPVTVQSALLSESHRARVTLAEGRVFEEMQNLTATMKANLGRVLSEGMAAGFGPKAIADQIYGEIGLPEWNDGSDKASYARALRISRTEINNAHRRARRGERDQARQIGLNLGVMHIATMRANTRRTHAARHGWVGTEQEEAQWYSRDANAINCRCAQIAVALDENGNVKSQKTVDRIERQRQQYIERYEEPT